MTDLDLDAIRARADAATEGPWRTWLDERRPNERTANVETAYIRDSYDPELITDWCWDADAKFIAHARSDVPELIDEIERLQEAAERIPKLLFNEEQHALEIYNEGISGGRAADDPMMIHLNGRILGLQRARDIAARVLEGDSDD